MKKLFLLVALAACANANAPADAPKLYTGVSGLFYLTIPVGTVSDSILVEVSNNGEEATTSLTVQITGTDAGQFLITSDGCSTLGTLTVASSCDLSVIFAPTGAAGTRNATLKIQAEPGGSTLSIGLSGTGS